MSSCDQCSRRAVIQVSSFRLCASHYMRRISALGLNANGLVYNAAMGCWDLPTPAQRTWQQQARASLTGPLAPTQSTGPTSIDQSSTEPSQARTASDRAISGMASLHPDERQRLEAAAGKVGSLEEQR